MRLRPSHVVDDSTKGGDVSLSFCLWVKRLRYHSSKLSFAHSVGSSVLVGKVSLQCGSIRRTGTRERLHGPTLRSKEIANHLATILLAPWAVIHSS